MKINNKNTIEYRGYIIFKNDNAMYWTYTIKGKMSADTLQGLKNLLANI